MEDRMETDRPQPDMRSAIMQIAALQKLTDTQMERLRSVIGREIKRDSRPCCVHVDADIERTLAEHDAILQRLDRAVSNVESAHRTLLRLRKRIYTGLALVGALGVLSLAAVYGALFGPYREEYDRLVGQVGFLEIMHRADVVPCGDERLCARVGEEAARP